VAGQGKIKKFMRYAESDGFPAALKKVYSYGSFLAKKIYVNKKAEVFSSCGAACEITDGRTSIVFSGKGVHIIRDGFRLTQNSGLNVAVNTLGLWTDSSKARWEAESSGQNEIRFKILFDDLPVSQNWIVSFEPGGRIRWNISMDVEELLHIDEIRFAVPVSLLYKSWVYDFYQGNFRRQDSQWHDLVSSGEPPAMVGARFSIGEKPLPAFVIEPVSSRSSGLVPMVQNCARDIPAHIVGFRRHEKAQNTDFEPGTYQLFSARIGLFDREEFVEEKIEAIRSQSVRTELLKTGVVSCAIPQKKSLNVLLVNLPWKKNETHGVRAGSRWPHMKDDSEGNYLPFPFFLAYATALLKKNNMRASLIDAVAEGMSEESFLDTVKERKPDYLVAETSVPSLYYDMALLRKISCLNIPIIVCGPNVTVYTPEFMEKYKFIDFVMCGEYEVTLYELIKTLQEGKNPGGVNGIMYRQSDGKPVKTPLRSPFDINCLPWPERDELPMRKYWDLPGGIPYPSVQMTASRGCPFGCSFCLWPQVMYGGNNYRARDVRDVVQEMEYLLKEKNFKSVYFDDDTFNVGKERMLDFCRLLKEKNLSGYPWAIMARADLMDEEILRAMKSSGLHAVKYGVESCHQELVEQSSKKMNLEKSFAMIKLSRDLGIKVHLTFCFGLPGETKESITRTIRQGLLLDPDSVQFSILTPFPGTSLFDELERDGRIMTYDWSRYDGHYSCVFRPHNLTPADLEQAKNRAYRLWADHVRKKRGIRGDIRRFNMYLKEHGVSSAVYKTCDYLRYMMFKRKSYISGQ